MSMNIFEVAPSFFGKTFWPPINERPLHRLPPTQKNVSMRDLIASHKVFFFDAYGVTRTRTGLYPFAEATLKEVLAQGKRFGVASNTAQDKPEDIQRKWATQGINIPLELIFTSGMMLAQYVKNNLFVGSRNVICIGDKTSQWYARQAGLNPLPATIAMRDYRDVRAVIVCESPNSKAQRTLMEAAANALFVNKRTDFVLTTPDRIVPYFHDRTPSGFSIGVESTAKTLADLTGRQPEIIGKPSPWMFFSLERALYDMKIKLREETLFVGDNLFEDGIGALTAGFQFLLVNTGISGAVKRGEICAESPIAQLDQSIIDAGWNPTYELDSIAL